MLILRKPSETFIKPVLPLRLRPTNFTRLYTYLQPFLSPFPKVQTSITSSSPDEVILHQYKRKIDTFVVLKFDTLPSRFYGNSLFVYPLVSVGPSLSDLDSWSMFRNDTRVSFSSCLWSWTSNLVSLSAVLGRVGGRGPVVVVSRIP